MHCGKQNNYTTGQSSNTHSSPSGNLVSLAGKFFPSPQVPCWKCLAFQCSHPHDPGPCWPGRPHRCPLQLTDLPGDGLWEGLLWRSVGSVQFPSLPWPWLSSRIAPVPNLPLPFLCIYTCFSLPSVPGCVVLKHLTFSLVFFIRFGIIGIWYFPKSEHFPSLCQASRPATAATLKMETIKRKLLKKKFNQVFQTEQQKVPQMMFFIDPFSVELDCFIALFISDARAIIDCVSLEQCFSKTLHFILWCKYN